MPIVGSGCPESGVRIEVERAREAEAPPWCYEGRAATPEAVFAVRATVEADGVVRVAIAEGAPHGLADKVERIVRAAHRHALDIDPTAPPPRRIVRWRER
jgi:hypothetical protein